MFGSHRPRVAALTLALALAIVAAGCGGNKVAGDQQAAPQSTTTTTSTPENVTTGGEVVVGVEASPASVDYVGGNGGPADSATAYAQSMLYEGLTALGADGTAKESLASSVEHNEDYTAWTAKVRDGVTFTDGTPLDAAAVVSSFKFRADPATCQCASRYEGVTVEATDPMTVRFTLASPNAHFAETIMSDQIAAPSTLKAGVDRNKTPVGTGPFRLVDRNSLQFERNDKYWRKDDKGRSLPYVDKVRLAPISDPSVRLAAIRKGEVQAMEVTDGRPSTPSRTTRSSPSSRPPAVEPPWSSRTPARVRHRTRRSAMPWPWPSTAKRSPSPTRRRRACRRTASSAIRSRSR